MLELKVMLDKTRSRLAPSFNRFLETMPMLWLLSSISSFRAYIRKMYNWVVSWAEKPQAEKALAGIAFAESSFFPIPPDPLLIAILTAKPERYIRVAAICTAGSVIGGIAGYFIGSFLFETVGRWIVDTYHLHEQFIAVGELYAAHAFLAIVIGGFTPIPYKLVAIAAGVFSINFPLFILASIISRGGRFFLVATLMHHLGKRYKDKIEQYIDGIGFVFILLVIAGFVAIKIFL